jgi:hypothetical protein
MILTAYQDVPIWKSSVFALLQSQDERGASTSMKDMKDDASLITVRLTREGERWWLASVKPRAEG